MIFLKIILCSSLLIALYYFFLEKEKMYRFNRFFLISSILFSYIVPFNSIKTNFTKPSGRSQLLIEETQQILYLSPKHESFNWEIVIWIIYSFITLILLIKAVISVSKIKNIKGKKLSYQNYNIILTKENISPFSFWNTIYLNESYFINNAIDARIFLHEKSHLDQKHSWDLLLIEALKIFTWFNPAVYFYKKAILTNHEFLADDAILENNFNIKDYQNLILQEVISTQKYHLIHQFNFNSTKKRFIMMNTKKSKLIAYKKVISIPVLIFACALFVQKTYANNSVSNINSKEVSKKINDVSIVKSTEKLFSTAEKEQNTKDEKKVLDTIRPKIVEISSKSGNENEKTITDLSIPPSESSDKSVITPAEYPGGTNEFRNKVAMNFNSGIFKGEEGMVKAIAYIAINEKGEVTDIKTTGTNEAFNNEVYRVVKMLNDNILWKPARKEGQPVAYHFKLPITMNFSNTK